MKRKGKFWELERTAFRKRCEERWQVRLVDVTGKGSVGSGAGEEGVALHGGRDIVAGEMKERGRDVQEMRALYFAARLEARGVEDEGAKLSVIAGVGAGVIFFDVQAAMAHAPDGTPIKAAEMHNQIGCDVAHVAIDLLGLEDE